MRIAVLSRSPRCYSTGRIREAARARGHDVDILDTSRFTILLEQNQPTLLYKGEPLQEYTAVIPRIGATITFFGSAVVRQFEHMGIFCLNCAQAITDARDKLRSMQLLSRHHIDIPTSAMVRSNKDILAAIKEVGGAPVILKLIQGTQGVGVILAESENTAEATIQTLRTARQNVLIQKFVSESRGRDIRALVIGDRVVAAMRRTAQKSEFRSNVHRGGKAEPVILDQAHIAIALRAAHVVGLHVAGVDLLESNDGPKVAEVNCSPGLKGIETSTGIDVAGAMIEYLQAQMDSPDVAGDPTDHYEVIELAVAAQSDLADEAIGGPLVEGRGLNVLRLTRDVEVIERPEPSTLLRPGDRILCFGRARELQALQTGRPAPTIDPPRDGPSSCVQGPV